MEAQHLVSTRKLVDSDQEQAIVEDLIERVKPGDVAGSNGLHYLLATPFRYPPLRHGSRFGTRGEPSLWYGSREVRTAFAEFAYYRLLFLEGTAAELDPITAEVAAFHVRVRTPRGVDLTAAPFTAHRRALSSPSRYASSQGLGRKMRAEGVEAFRYFSARDTEEGVNVALFTPKAFAAHRPDRLETWHSRADREGVEVRSRNLLERRGFVFPRTQFEVRGSLPAPAF